VTAKGLCENFATTVEGNVELSEFAADRRTIMPPSVDRRRLRVAPTKLAPDSP
jgi:hypothetical protein